MTEKELFEIQLNYYNFFVKRVTQESAGSGQVPTTEITFGSTAWGIEPNTEKFVKDIQLLDTIRSSYDPAVKDAWESLLTTMALVKGRDANKVSAPKAEPAQQ